GADRKGPAPRVAVDSRRLPVRRHRRAFAGGRRTPQPGPARYPRPGVPHSRRHACRRRHRFGATGTLMRDFQRTLQRRARKAGVTVSADVSERLEAYFSLLTRWNARINLTALNLASGDEAIDRLLVEPLIAARIIAETDSRLIDIGSGGGSPAIPLAIACPQLHLTMVESKVRKSAFLREAVRTIGLEAVVQTARYETLLADPAMHESADVLSLRAVRADVRILMGLQAFVKPGGRMFL